MDKTDKSITDVSLKVFLVSQFVNFSLVYPRLDILSVWLGAHFPP